jgi:P-type conjugative transfer protein TrbG
MTNMKTRLPRVSTICNLFLLALLQLSVIGCTSLPPAGNHVFKKQCRCVHLPRPNTLYFPFGKTIPVLHCRTFFLRDIALEAGEQVYSINVGDSARWQVNWVQSACFETIITHILVKPLAENIETNLIITTDRRVYQFKVCSDHSADIRLVQFYYPFEHCLDKNDIPAHDKSASHYRIKSAHLFSKPAWMPIAAFDDGQKVYIEMPMNITHLKAPALLQVSHGQTNVMNYRMRGKYYIVDQLFDRAMLVLDVGKRQEKVWLIRQTRDDDGR